MMSEQSRSYGTYGLALCICFPSNSRSQRVECIINRIATEIKNICLELYLFECYYGEYPIPTNMVIWVNSRSL